MLRLKAEALEREAAVARNQLNVKQVELEFLERLEFVDVPEAAFPEDPERQQELHAELRRTPTIKALQEAGATTLRALADGLNAQGIPTARGLGKWSPTQVARVLDRL